MINIFLDSFNIYINCVMVYCDLQLTFCLNHLCFWDLLLIHSHSSFNYFVLLQFMVISHVIYSFFCWWFFKLCPVSHYSRNAILSILIYGWVFFFCCCFFVCIYGRISLGYIPRSGITGLEDLYISALLYCYCRIVF